MTLPPGKYDANIAAVHAAGGKINTVFTVPSGQKIPHLTDMRDESIYDSIQVAGKTFPPGFWPLEEIAQNKTYAWDLPNAKLPAPTKPGDFSQICRICRTAITSVYKLRRVRAHDPRRPDRTFTMCTPCVASTNKLAQEANLPAREILRHVLKERWKADQAKKASQ